MAMATMVIDDDDVGVDVGPCDCDNGSECEGAIFSFRLIQNSSYILLSLYIKMV